MASLGATAPRTDVDRPQQLWLDVDRPIAPRRARDPASAGTRRAPASDLLADRQMELRMAPAPERRIADPCVPRPPAQPDPIVAAFSAEPERPSFVGWLMGQAKRGGAIGELAKAARLDPLFPRNGSVEAVRARFSKAGADGDAFAALDDAERAYDRTG